VLRAQGTRPLQRLLFRLLGGQFGDFRDWPAIDRWADGIASRLSTGTLTGGGHG
jgi:menaquinone-dependent protoporphyrinogen oxidase